MSSFTLSFSFYCFCSWVLFTELEHCPTHVLLSFLVQKVQKLEISMPAQCHHFDELLLTMIKKEHFFHSTAVDLYQGLFRYEQAFSRSATLLVFLKFRADKVLFPQFIGLLTRRAFTIVHIGRFCYFY